VLLLLLQAFKASSSLFSTLFFNQKQNVILFSPIIYFVGSAAIIRDWFSGLPPFTCSNYQHFNHLHYFFYFKIGAKFMQNLRP
jgi:hypothetical protein